MNKIEELKKEFEDGSYEAKEVIKRWESDIRFNKAVMELGDNEIIKLILSDYKAEIEKINQDLLNDTELTLEKRNLLFCRRSWCQLFIDRFENAKNVIKETEKLINDELDG